MTNNQVVPYAYEPPPGEPLKHKSYVAPHTFTLYLQQLNIKNMELYQCLQHILNVQDAVKRETKDETDETIGTVLNEAFAWTLTQTDRGQWDELEDYVDEDGNDLNPVENWQNKARDWIQTKFGEEEAHSVRVQLESWKKPRHVSIIENLQYMRMVNSFIPFISEHTKPLDDDQFKQAFFNSHPDKWKSDFRLHKSVPDTSIEDMATHMQMRADLADKSQHENQLKQ